MNYISKQQPINLYSNHCAKELDTTSDGQEEKSDVKPIIAQQKNVVAVIRISTDIFKK